MVDFIGIEREQQIDLIPDLDDPKDLFALLLPVTQPAGERVGAVA
jgi:hypothetical protein